MADDIQNGAAKGWAKISSDGTISSPSYNVASVTKGSAGVYTINWDTNFSDSDTAIIVSSVGDDTAKAFVEAWATSYTLIHTYLNGSIANRHFAIVAFGKQ